MTTANFPFEQIIDTSKETRHSLKQATVLGTNMGDFTLEQARELRYVGFSGIYHAVRLNEGKDT